MSVGYNLNFSEHPNECSRLTILLDELLSSTFATKNEEDKDKV